MRGESGACCVCGTVVGSTLASVARGIRRTGATTARAQTQCWWLRKSAYIWRTQDVGVDFLESHVLENRATDGRKLAYGHGYPLRQGVASGHPTKGRSVAGEPRSGLMRRNPLVPVTTSCGFSNAVLAIYPRFFAAINNAVTGRRMTKF